MMSKFPEAMLPPQSVQWGRKMQETLQAMEREGERRALGEKNANKGQNATLGAVSEQIQALLATQAELAVAQAYQASLITKATNGVDIIALDIPGDQVYRYVDTGITVTVPVPTGRAIVTIGCSLLRTDVGNSTVEGLLTFSAEDSAGVTTFPASNTFAAKMLSSVAGFTGAAASFSTPFLVPSNGIRTFRLHYGTWSASTAPLGAVRITRPYIRAQVIPAEPAV